MGTLEDFQRIAIPHIDAAYNLAQWLVRNPADAEDVVQDAYLRAFKSFGQFAGGDVRPWLLTIVRNVAYRWLSTRKRSANVISIEQVLSARDDGSPSAIDLPSPDRSAEDLLIGQADVARVHDALAALPPAFREVVILRDLEELSYRDIAEIIGTPIGTVMSRLSRARQQLRQELERMAAKDNSDAL